MPGHGQRAPARAGSDAEKLGAHGDHRHPGSGSTQDSGSGTSSDESEVSSLLPLEKFVLPPPPSVALKWQAFKLVLAAEEPVYNATRTSHRLEKVKAWCAQVESGVELELDELDQDGPIAASALATPCAQSA